MSAEAPGAASKIQEVLIVIHRAKGSVCLTCLGLSEQDEVPLVKAFGVDIPPKHRLVEGTCGLCGKGTRVVRKLRVLH